MMKHKMNTSSSPAPAEAPATVPGSDESRAELELIYHPYHDMVMTSAAVGVDAVDASDHHRRPTAQAQQQQLQHRNMQIIIQRNSDTALQQARRNYNSKKNNNRSYGGSHSSKNLKKGVPFKRKRGSTEIKKSSSITTNATAAHTTIRNYHERMSSSTSASTPISDGPSSMINSPWTYMNNNDHGHKKNSSNNAAMAAASSSSLSVSAPMFSSLSSPMVVSMVPTLSSSPSSSSLSSNLSSLKRSRMRNSNSSNSIMKTKRHSLLSKFSTTSLSSSSSTSPSSKKMLTTTTTMRRSISWDVRPPKVIDSRTSTTATKRRHSTTRSLVNSYMGEHQQHVHHCRNTSHRLTQQLTKMNVDAEMFSEQQQKSLTVSCKSQSEEPSDGDRKDATMTDQEVVQVNSGHGYKEGNQHEDEEDEPTDKNEAWYSKEDYKKFLKEQFVTVHIMQQLRQTGTDEAETDLDPETYCERGLENYESKELRNGIDATRRLQKLLVIQEHTRQAVLGMKDDEQIRWLAGSLSERSSVKAQLRAALDQYEVETTVKSNGFASPLEALLAEQRKKMMKEVIGELHKEQQDLCTGQQQHPQHRHQEYCHNPFEGGHLHNMIVPPITAAAAASVQDTSHLNHCLGSMTMEDCDHARFLATPQNLHYYASHTAAVSSMPSFRAILSQRQQEQLGQQHPQHMLQSQAVPGTSFGYTSVDCPDGHGIPQAASNFSHRAGSAA